MPSLAYCELLYPGNHCCAVMAPFLWPLSLALSPRTDDDGPFRLRNSPRSYRSCCRPRTLQRAACRGSTDSTVQSVALLRRLGGLLGLFYCTTDRRSAPVS